jgi:hypothetical protein
MPEETRNFPANELPIGPLWRETKYTDGQHVTVFVHDPVTKMGAVDLSREKRFLGHTLVNIGLPTPTPVTFLVVGAKNLEHALALYPSELSRAAETAVKHLEKEMQEHKQKIVRAGDKRNSGARDSRL